MSDTVVLNSVEVNDELKKAIEEAIDPADVRALILANAAKQTEDKAVETATAEKAAADKAAEVAANAVVEPPAATVFTRTETIGGKEFIFEASSELELERYVNNALRVAYSVQAPEPAAVVVDPAVAAAEAQKAVEDKASALADLELKWKRGEISAADYIEQSGAVDAYLEKKGVSISELKATVEQNRNASYAQDWETATETFKKSPAGLDWPGGERNKTQLGLQLVALGLTEAEDKVAAMAQAYAEMKKLNIIFENEDAVKPDPAAEAAAAQAVAAATAAREAAAAATAATVAAAAAVQKKAAPTSSSLFGQSSGSGGATPTTPAADKVDVPADASPTEIMDAWKKAQVAAGKNPDSAFMERFRAKSI